VAWCTVTGLRLAVSPGAAGSNFALDWFRVVQPASGAQVTWSNPGGAPAEIVWVANSSEANNITSQTGGVISSVTGTLGTVDLSVLPTGSFQIGVRSSLGVDSGWQQVTLASPLPRFITPNAVGDREYARTIRRNPWDLNSASDVTKVGNANRVSYAGGQLAATNTSNDPFVSLRVGAGGFNSRVFRNLTVTSAYNGPFNLRNIAGGGTMARVMWTRSDRARGQTDDIVTYSGSRAVSIDMGLPTGQLVEPGTRSASFLSSARVTALRAAIQALGRTRGSPVRCSSRSVAATQSAPTRSTSVPGRTDWSGAARSTCPEGTRPWPFTNPDNESEDA